MKKGLKQNVAWLLIASVLAGTGIPDNIAAWAAAVSNGDSRTATASDALGGGNLC